MKRSTRDRQPATEMEGYFDKTLADPEAEAKRKQFYHDLANFYKRRWNVPLRVPMIGGITIDIYKLYNKVTELGGWVKVTVSGKWLKVMEELGISDDINNGEHALKLFYMQFLNRYERATMFGETDDDGDETGGRSARRTFLHSVANAECPYIRPKSDLPTNYRLQIGLSARRPLNPYWRLIKSLESGLPNEVDFAMNTLTLLSHPGPRLIKLGDAPQIITLLMAHIGIFNEGRESLRSLYETGWSTVFDEAGKDNVSMFGRKSVNRRGVCDSYAVKPRRYLDFWYAGLSEDDQDTRILLGPPDTPENVEEGRLRITSRDREIFAGGLAQLEPPFDTKNPTTHRIMQIAAVLRNLSFEHGNRRPLGSSYPLIKFLYVCIRSRYSQLQSIAFDIISNIAVEISLEKNTQRLIYGILAEGLFSDDKFAIIRTLEVLAGLAQNEANEGMLCEMLEESWMAKLTRMLVVKDIMTCVHTLEALYNISNIGSSPCQQIAGQSRAIDVLFNLATIEAVSFGPSGLAGMKVVEYGLPQQQTQQQQQMVRRNPPPPTPQQASTQQQQQQRLPPPGPPQAIPQHHPITIIRPQQSINPPPPHQFIQQGGRPQMIIQQQQGHGQQQPMMMGTAVVLSQSQFPPPAPPRPQLPPPPPPQPSASSSFRGPITVQQNQQAENLTITWLKNNLVLDVKGLVDRGELYAAYVNEMNSVYNSLAVSAATFSTFIRQAFPSCSIRLKEGGSMHRNLMQIEGVRFETKPATSTTIAAAAAAAANNQRQKATQPPSITDGDNKSTGAGAAGLVQSHPLVNTILKSTYSTTSSSTAVTTTTAATATSNSSFKPPQTSFATSSSSAVNSNNPTATTTASPSTSASPAAASSAESTIQQQSHQNNGRDERSTMASDGNNENSRGTSATPDSLISNNTKPDENNSSSPLPSSPLTKSSTTGNNQQEVIVGKLPSNCHLEVCQQAQEAKNIIDQGEIHEAKIVRVENTASSSCSGGSSDFTNIPSSTSSSNTVPIVPSSTSAAAPSPASSSAATTGQSESPESSTLATVGGDGRVVPIQIPIHLQNGQIPPNSAASFSSSKNDDPATANKGPSSTSNGHDEGGVNKNKNGGDNSNNNKASSSTTNGMILVNGNNNKQQQQQMNNNNNIVVVDNSNDQLTRMTNSPSPDSIKMNLTNCQASINALLKTDDSNDNNNGSNNINSNDFNESSSSSNNNNNINNNHDSSNHPPSTSSSNASNQAQNHAGAKSSDSPTIIKAAAAAVPSKPDSSSIIKSPSSTTSAAAAAASALNTNNVNNINNIIHVQPSNHLIITSPSSNVTNHVHQQQQPLKNDVDSEASRDSMMSYESSTSARVQTSTPLSSPLPNNVMYNNNNNSAMMNKSAAKKPPNRRRKNTISGEANNTINGGANNLINTNKMLISNHNINNNNNMPTTSNAQIVGNGRVVIVSGQKRLLDNGVLDSSAVNIGGGPEVKHPRIISAHPSFVRTFPGGTATATQLKLMCEWNGCGMLFDRAQQVYFHCAKQHVTPNTTGCLWPHCDPNLYRHQWSLTTHLQDGHCSEQMLRTAALRRYEKSVTPNGESSIPEPRTPPPHPGYSRTAAIDAVRRHALTYLPKELTEENEGPVTKSIRLTSSLILRNLARYSSEGRRQLKRHERTIAWMALSRLESNMALSQLLAELSSPSFQP